MKHYLKVNFFHRDSSYCLESGTSDHTGYLWVGFLDQVTERRVTVHFSPACLGSRWCQGKLTISVWVIQLPWQYLEEPDASCVAALSQILKKQRRPESVEYSSYFQKATMLSCVDTFAVLWEKSRSS